MSEVTKEKLVGDVKDVISDAEVLLKDTAANVSDKAKGELARLKDRLAVAKERIVEAEKVVKDKAIAGAKETDKAIRNHPYESMGVAFAAGLLIGFLVSRR